MQETLTQLNAVPGVVGTFVCDAEGHLLGRAVPKGFTDATLARAARALADGTGGLAAGAGKVALLDLRYAEARVVVRPLRGAHLVCLCRASLNLQSLTIASSVAARKLERALGGAPVAPGAASPPGGALHRLVQRIDAAAAHRKLDPCKVRGAVGMKAGFALGFVDADTPDDPEKLARLQAAAAAVLGEKL
jgi:hypothetical protein